MTGQYLGEFDSFEFTAAADTAAGAIKTSGGYVGVTKANVASGEKGLAFMGGFMRVYEFTVTALGANKDLGTAVYIDGDGDITWDSNDGSSPATAYTQLGWLWAAGTAGDTTIKVALKARS